LRKNSLTEKKQRYDEWYYRGRNSNYIFWYNNLKFEIFWRRRQKILNKITDSGKLLDVGCAFGFFIKLLENKFEVYGIDISEYAIKQAKRLISKPDHLKCFDVHKGILFDERFDVITAFDIMEHISDPLPIFIFFNESLKKGGNLYLELPLSKTLINRDVGHYYSTLKNWTSILNQAGFKPWFIQGYYTIGLRIVMFPTGRFINYCSIIAKKL